MRSAPFRRFVVADSLGWLLFLTKFFFSSRNFSERKKSFKNFFVARVSACACAINAFGSHRHIVPVCLRSAKFLRPRVQCCVVLASIGFPQSNSIVPICLCSVKFLRARVRCCVVLASIGFLQSNSIVSCSFICARSNSFVFFSDLENLRRSTRNLLVQTTKT